MRKKPYSAIVLNEADKTFEARYLQWPVVEIVHGSLIYKGFTQYDPAGEFADFSWFGDKEVARSYISHEMRLHGIHTASDCGVVAFQVQRDLQLIYAGDVKWVQWLHESLNQDSFPEVYYLDEKLTAAKVKDALEKVIVSSQQKVERYSFHHEDRIAAAYICNLCKKLGLDGFATPQLSEHHPEVVVCEPKNKLDRGAPLSCFAGTASPSLRQVGQH